LKFFAAAPFPCRRVGGAASGRRVLDGRMGAPGGTCPTPKYHPHNLSDGMFIGPPPPGSHGSGCVVSGRSGEHGAGSPGPGGIGGFFSVRAVSGLGNRSSLPLPGFSGHAGDSPSRILIVAVLVGRKKTVAVHDRRWLEARGTARCRCGSRNPPRCTCRMPAEGRRTAQLFPGIVAVALARRPGWRGPIAADRLMRAGLSAAGIDVGSRSR